jgi:hypothetical protein
LANFILAIRQIGECPQEFRQLAKMIIENILFIGEFHTSNSPIGEVPEEFRQLANMIIENILFIGEFHSNNSPGLKEYLKSASLMMGKIAGQSTNSNDVDRTAANEYLIQDEDEND